MNHFPDPLLSARFGNIQGTVLSPVSKLDLASYINQFGNLIFGSLQPHIFNQNFNSSKKRHLSSLINSSFDDAFQRQDLQFYLHMMHEAQKIDNWRWPGIATHNNIDIEWTKGGSRLFATAMTKQNPHKLLNFLILQNRSIPVDAYVQDPVLVTDDTVLHKVLDVNPNDDSWTPHCELVLNYNINDSTETLELANLKDPNDFTDHTTAGEELLRAFLQWRRQYGNRPTLQIYTNWPELIKNTHNAWDIKIAGDVNEIKQNIRYPAHLENQVIWLDNFRKPSNNDHIFVVVEPRSIDVAELLFWVDLERTTFISSDWSSLLYRPGAEYKNTFIDLSYIETNK